MTIEDDSSQLLLSVLESYRTNSEPVIVELQDISHKPVAALYFDRLKYDGDLAISTTNTDERYFLYFNGTGIYFSFYKIIQKG